MYKEIQEASSKIKIPVEKKISKKLPVFYNPVMKFNRDISILLLNTLGKKDLQIADIMAGTGIRSIRLLKELKKSIIKNITVNDYDANSVKQIKNNLKLNKIKQTKEKDKKVIVANKDANMLLLESSGYDYIDIDPFGTPNPFLDSSVKRIARDGILAVTATDTSALCGTYPSACRRKYWAEPSRDSLMHELGLRILIRKVQLIAAQFEKALTPIYSYSKDHYMRIFFICEKGKSKVDDILKLHGMYRDAGPLWLGELYDKKLAARMAKNNDIPENQKILDIIKEESKIPTIGFYDIHKLCKKNKLQIPKKDILVKMIRKKHKVSGTHFSDSALRSDIPKDKLLSIIRNI